MDTQRIRTTWVATTSEEANFRMRAMADHRTDCGISGADVVGHETIWGQRTVVRLFDLDSNSQIKDWTSPELGCHIIQSQRIRKSDGQVIVEEKPLHVNLGEPDPSLFDPGSSYKEVLPSILLSARLQAVGVEPDDQTLQMGRDLDRQHQRVARSR
jgi:hypothetical protein